MSDIDLIAEGRVKLAAVAESPSTDRAFDLAAYAALNLTALLDGLETARARIAELEGERPAIDEALERAYDAEGYVDTLAEILSEGAAPLTWDEAVMGTDRKISVLPRHGLLAAARAALVDRDAARARVAELEARDE